MRLGVQDVADVLDPETQLADVRLRRRHGLRQGAVDQDQPVPGVDQHHAETAGADEIGVAVQLQRRLRLHPVRVPRDRLRQRIIVQDACASGQEGDSGGEGQEHHPAIRHETPPLRKRKTAAIPG
ncbi:hypothetical protein D3C80_1803020 [compost metagenome]